MKHTKIETSEAVKRWNAQVELTDLALALAADDVTSPRKLYSLLSVAGHHSLAASLRTAGAELGYFGDGHPDNPGERPTTAPGCQTKSQDGQYKSTGNERDNRLP